MSISQEQLEKIAGKLSKLPANNPKLLCNINDILWYIDLLKEVDTSDTAPTFSVMNSSAYLREDSKTQDSASPQELLGCSKQKIVSDQIVLPNIMN